MSCKNCKKHAGNTFPKKKLVLISKNKIKRKSKGAICLTEIENKYDLESKVLTGVIKETWRLIA